MSLILDALNRSRQDVGDIPGLQSQHQLTEGSATNSNRWWLLALLVALGVIAFLLYERGDDSTPAARSVQPVVVPEPVEPKSEKKAVPAPAVTESPAAQLQAPPPAEKAPAKSAPDAQVAALYANKTAPAEEAPATVAKETVAEQPVDIEAMMNQARDELENAQLEEHPAPFLSSLSQQSKDRIPTIFYERHDYSGRPGQSTVVLGGRTLKRGGRTSSGVQVDEILPDSVVLTYQGTQFRLRALNSWVNL